MADFNTSLLEICRSRTVGAGMAILYLAVSGVSCSIDVYPISGKYFNKTEERSYEVIDENP